MSPPAEETLEGLHWETRLPIQLLPEAEGRPVEEWTTSELPALYDERLLKVLTAGEEQTGSAWSDDAENRARQRLEAKVDLLLAAMAWQDQRQAPLPVRRVHLFESGLKVALPAADCPPLAIGDPLRIQLRIDAAQPFPLTITCELLANEVSADGHWLTFGYRADNAEIRELMVKFIFRQHRRELATRRRELGD